MNIITSNENNFFRLYRLKKYLENHNGFISGGCFKNIFNDQKVKDVDIFFRNEKDFKEALDLFTKSKKYKVKYENDNCNAFIDLEKNITIELIKKSFGQPEELISKFDFTIVQATYYGIKNNEGEIEYKFSRSWRFFEDLHQRKLVIDGESIPYPVNTFERVLKYTKYGFGLCRESKYKLINSLRDVPENEINISNSLYNGFD